MNFIPQHKRAADSGFTLVEVLVALVVLSIGLLGLAALQLSSLQFNTNSLFRTQATVAAYDIIDRMRSNRAGFKANAYQVLSLSDAANVVSTYATCSGGSGSCNCQLASNPCTPTDLATYDLGNWYLQTDSLLPGSSSNRATISRDATTNEVTITINWVEKDASQSKVWKVRL
jgi:type IV pilus assembly protein PilV